MSNSQTTQWHDTRGKPGGPMRAAGIIVLIIGLAIAGLVYGLSKPAEDSPDDMATPDNSKIAAREVARNFGQMGAFSYSLAEYLKDPAIRATIIALVSALAACGCFYIAHLQTRDPHNYRPNDKQ